MFGIGETELVIIVVFAFLLFGPDKLPGMGRTLGRVLRQFREASDGFTEVVQTNIMDPASEELEKSPKQRKREAAELEATAGDGADAVQASEEAVPPRRETFAERKARLLAERKAAEDAAAQAATPVATGSDDATAAEPTDVKAAGTTQQQAVEVQPSPEPKRTSAADLYAPTTQKSSRTLAKEAAQAEAEAEAQPEAPQSGEEDGEE